jgi:pSer/pThr/pTyr-binding forkhead associated (FHA) protein
MPAAHVAHAAGGERRCKICDTVNGAALRYCTSCGSTLDAAPAPALTPIASPANAIVPVGTVNVATSAAPEASATRTCGRCKGTAEASAQFCKFCGNSLVPDAPAANGAARASANGSAASVAPVVSAVPVRPAPVASASPIGPAAGAPAAAPALAPTDRASGYGPPPQAIPLGPAQAIPLGPAPAPVQAPAPAARPLTSPQRGRLVVIAKSGADGPSYPFGDILDIGRTEGNVIVGEDPYLSPRHVRLAWEKNKLVLRDLGSTNGVFLRLAPLRDTSPRRGADSAEVAVPLVDHDLILVGQQVLRFDILREGEAGFGPAQEHGTLLFGSPAAPRYARLSQRTVEGIARDVYYVRKVETVLGRESGDVVFTEDPFLSRRHAAIRLLSPVGAGGATSGDVRFALVDLGSSNGTFLRTRSDVELAPGDHFRVGQQLFRVDFDGMVSGSR